MLSLRKGCILPHSAYEASAEVALTSQLHFKKRSYLEEPEGEATPEASLFHPEGAVILEASLFQPKSEAILA